MIILAVQDIQKSFGTHEVLKGVSFTLQEQERMGLVGVNGSGKSTLMKIIAGIETADSGTVSIQKGLRIGYLAQQGEFREGETVRETLESVFEPLVQMEAEMRDLEQKMAEQGDDPEALAGFVKRRRVLHAVMVRQRQEIQPDERSHSGNVRRGHIIVGAGRQTGMKMKIVEITVHTNRESSSAIS